MIFNPKEAKVDYEIKVADEKNKYIRIVNLVNEKKKEFELLKVKYKVTKAKDLYNHKLIIDRLNNEKKELINTVDTLEFKKKEALKPIIQETQALNELRASIKQSKEDIKAKEKELVIDNKKLGKRTKDVDLKEKEINISSDKLETNKGKHNKDVKRLRASELAHSKKVEKFNEFEGSAREEIDINNKKLKVRESIIETTLKNIESQNEDIQEQKELIESRQQQLKIAFDEARAKDIL